jgi:hypothetical protein
MNSPNAAWVAERLHATGKLGKLTVGDVTDVATHLADNWAVVSDARVAALVEAAGQAHGFFCHGADQDYAPVCQALADALAPFRHQDTRDSAEAPDTGTS